MIDPPVFMNKNFTLRVLESSRNFQINIGRNPTAFPVETVSFTWTRDGQPLISGPGLSQTYSSVTFSSVNRQDSGNYSVFASNVVEGIEVGNDTGSFSLDVICKLFNYYDVYIITLNHRYYIKCTQSCAVCVCVCVCVCVFVCVCICMYACVCWVRLFSRGEGSYIW